MPESTTTPTGVSEYKALIEYAPDGALDPLPWRATIYADGVRVERLWSATRERIEEHTREWVAAVREREANPVDARPEWVEL